MWCDRTESVGIAKKKNYEKNQTFFPIITSQ